jgi:hypothetical protein
LIERLLSRKSLAAQQVLIHPTSWVMSDYVSLARRAPSIIIEPGRRLPVLLAARGQRHVLHRVTGATEPPEILRALARSHDLSDVIEGVVTQIGGIAAGAAADVRRLTRGGRIAVTTEDASPILRSAVLAARSEGLRTISLEHGISGSLRHQVESIANVLGVWGKPHLEYHRPRQSRTSVEIIGATRMEQLWCLRRSSRRDLDAVFFAQPAPTLSAANWPEDQIQAVRWIEEVARIHPNWRIAVKPHPAAEAYGSALTSTSKLPRLRETSREILRRTKVAIVVTSTAGAEAQAEGIPVIQVVGESPMDEPSLLIGGTQPVSDGEGLNDALGELLGNPAALATASREARDHARHLVSQIDRPGSALRRLEELVSRFASDLRDEA